MGPVLAGYLIAAGRFDLAFAAAHGVFGTIYDVGDALGPIATGLLVAAVGYTRMFQVMAAVALTMAVAFAFASGIGVTGRVAPRT